MKNLLNITLALITFVASAGAQQQEINWIEGPTKANIGGIAEIYIPEGFLYTDKRGSEIFMEMCENPVTGAELGTLINAEGTWYVVLQFNDIGYVKDDEKDQLDATAILDTIRRRSEEDNKIRRQNGWGTIEVVGWAREPFYNPVSNNLEWATIVQHSQGYKLVNYNTRLLGRNGVMAATLVTDPQTFTNIQGTYQQTIAGFNYIEGHHYAEWKKGDRIAQLGLSGLILGGGAAVASKTGLLTKFWKILLIPIIAVGAFFKKLIGR